MALALPIRRSAGRSFLVPQSPTCTSRSQLDRRRLISSAVSRNSAAAAAAAAVVAHQDDEYHVGPEKPAELRKFPSPEQKKFLESALRVNHAGELAAVLIYAAQRPPILKAYPHLKGLMQHMYDQEAGHFKTFNELLPKHRIRPTLMYPVWKVAATALGWSTAVMGREAAMACTEAVETEIGDHYNNQVRELLQWEANGQEMSGEMRHLLVTLRRIRDEELEHLDSAVENDAKKADPYELLTTVIRTGCRGAIWVSERI